MHPPHIDYRIRVATKRAADRQSKHQQQLLRQYEARRAVHEEQGARRRRDNVIAVVAMIVVATLAGLGQWAFFTSGPGAPEPEPTATQEPTSAPEDPAGQNVGDVPPPDLAEGRTWTGTLTINDLPLGIELDGAAAPQAVSVLVDAVASGYYAGTACHRLVVSDGAELLQCGSLDGTGASDPGFSYGPLENTGAGGVYPAGTIAIARTGGNAYGNGRQFFIVTADTFLPDDAAGGYSIVGRVVDGLDALVTEVVAAGTADGGQDGPPAVPTTITGFTIQ